MVVQEEYKGPKMERTGRTSRFRRICVFCGSSAGKKTLYSNVALELGKEMVRRKIDLVYGGGSNGLMGQISRTVHEGGGRVIGVIPKALAHEEISGTTIGELRAVADMHERKAEMARQADAFIALPGGYGTLEELLEMITWVQLGIHDKPVGLLNVDGYYNSLLALLDKAVEEGFLKPNCRNILLSAPSARELLDKFEAYEPTHEQVCTQSSWDADKPAIVERRDIEQLAYGSVVGR